MQIDREALLREMIITLQLFEVGEALGTKDDILAELLVKHLESMSSFLHVHDNRGEGEVIEPICDSEGNPKPEHATPGYAWVLEHTALDQGHYGISRWKEVPKNP